ncbi:hypothetical protein OAI07_01160 [Akkermansiaceae bacterium]|nr:hypothetical protein [Akkermansiaceae bacterium]
MQKQPYDIIGDLHGHYHKLIEILETLGYIKGEKAYYHPEGRKIAFLGDYIDPKSNDIPHDVPAVLKTVKAMVDDNQAVAIMGNHEFNAVAYATQDGDGSYLRPHETRNREQGRKSYEAMEGGFDGAEWQGWIKWFKALPMFLELDGLRLVHAFWKQDAIDALKKLEEKYGRPLLENHDFLVNANKRGEYEYQLVEWVLKGLEIELPVGKFYHDHQGIKRKQFRAKWFEDELNGKGVADLTFPFGVFEVENHPLPEIHKDKFPGYSKAAPPVFFGHYFKPENDPLKPELPNLACLDFSIAKGGPIVAYRWNGEQTLDPENYLSR